jgi:hypothetical protein
MVSPVYCPAEGNIHITRSLPLGKLFYGLLGSQPPKTLSATILNLLLKNSLAELVCIISRIIASTSWKIFIAILSCSMTPWMTRLHAVKMFTPAGRVFSEFFGQRLDHLFGITLNKFDHEEII